MRTKPFPNPAVTANLLLRNSAGQREAAPDDVVELKTGN
jgi:hypothetical protein